ncbi:MAG: ATP-binding protein [Pseudomonadota bacterium]
MFREFAVSRAGLASAIEAVKQRCQEMGIGPEIANPVCIILDEMVGNMMMHGDLGEASQFTVEVDREEGGARIVISDPGAAFDPLSWPPDSRSGPGGRGIALVKGLASRLAYARSGEQNVLTAWVWPKP